MEEIKSSLVRYYRVQNIINGLVDGGLFCEDKEKPVKRVLVDKKGNIIFNPNNERYIYFSPEKLHHMYYLFTKLIQLIHLDERKVSDRDLKIIDIVKKIKKDNQDKLNLRCLETCSLVTLPSLAEFVSDCSLSNKKKYLANGTINVPESTDQTKYGGGIGLADEWLELLSELTFFVDTSQVSYSTLFDMMSKRADLHSKNMYMRLPYKREFFSNYNIPVQKSTIIMPTLKNCQVCLIRKSINTIYNNRYFNTSNPKLDDNYFDAKLKQIETEYRRVRAAIKSRL